MKSPQIKIKLSQTKTLSTTPFNPLNPDPFLGYKPLTKYIKIPGDGKQQVYFTYWKNKNLIVNPPLLITNIGGPGFTSQIQLFQGGGPFHFDYRTNTQTHSEHTHLSYADLLVPDLVMGAGWSIAKKLDIDRETSARNCVKFFEELHKEHPELNLKSRTIIVYGISDGATLWAQVVVKLLELGYEIKGMYLDSPYIDPFFVIKNFGRVIKKSKLIKRGPLKKKLIPHAKKCYKQMMQPNFSPKDGKFCNQLYDNWRPYCGKDHILKASPYDTNKKTFSKMVEFYEALRLMFVSDDTKQTFKAKKTNNFSGKKVLKSQQEPNFNHYYWPNIDKILALGIKITIVTGQYDAICGPINTVGWLKKLDFFKYGRFDAKNFKKSDIYGYKYKDFGQVRYEVAPGAYHNVGEARPDIVVSGVKNLIESIDFR